MLSENLKREVIEELKLMSEGKSFRKLKITSDGETATFKPSHPYSSKKAKKFLEKVQDLENISEVYEDNLKKLNT